MAHRLKTQAQSIYGLPSPISSTFPPPVVANIDPSTADVGFDIGQIWINQTTGTVYALGAIAGGLATWSVLGGSSADVNTLSGDAGAQQTPTGGNIQIAGTAAQGISTSGAASTITITASNATTAQKGVVALATDAEAIAGADSAKAIVSTSMKAKLGTQTLHGLPIGASDSVAVAWTAAPTDGQILIGATGATPALGSIAVTASTGLSVTPGANTITLAGVDATTSVKGITQLATDSETRIGTNSTHATTPSNITALRNYTNQIFRSDPIMQSAATTGGVPTGADGDLNEMMLEFGEVMQAHVNNTAGGGAVILAPRMDATGLLVSGDLVATDGMEYNWGMAPNNKHAYTIGTSPAFFFQVQFNVADVSGADPILMGFRLQQANNDVYTAYTDYALIGLNQAVNAGTVIIEDRLNAGAAVQTNTTNAWVDGGTHTLKVMVSGTGVVTYTIDGAAPSVTHAFTFDNGDVVSPFFYLVQGAALPTTIDLISMQAGLQ